MQIVNCKHCLNPFEQNRKDKIYCSRSCKSTACGIRTGRFTRARPWIEYKEDKCNGCGFIPVHSCQLDVDHIDGNKKNSNPENLQTLCANCHRLKTFLNKDWGRKKR